MGAGLGVPMVSLSPDEVLPHFGWIAMFMAMDLRASSAQTREKLGWHPTGPGLIAALAREAASYWSLDRGGISREFDRL
jgi:hypothetical protein